LLSKNFLNENYDKANRTDIEKIADLSENEKMFHELISQDVNDPQHGWYKSLEQKEKDGYTAVIHQRALPGKQLNVVRNQAIMKGIHKETAKKIMYNFEKYQKRFDTHNSQVSFRMIEEAKEVDGVMTLAATSRSKMGPMCSDRDALYKVIVKPLSDTKTLSISTTYEDPAIPCPDGCVRMQYFKAT